METANPRQKRYKITYKQSGDSKSKTEKVQAHSQTIWRQQIQDRKGTSSLTIWRQQIQDRTGTSSPTNNLDRLQIQDRTGTSSLTNNLETANTRQKGYKLTHKQYGDGKSKTEKVQAHSQTIWTDSKPDIKGTSSLTNNLDRQQIKDRKGTSSVTNNLDRQQIKDIKGASSLTNNLETANTRQKRYKLTYKQSGDSKYKTEKVQAHLQTIWRQQIQDRKGTSSLTNNLETANSRQKRYKLTHKQSGQTANQRHKRYKLTHKQSGDSKYKTEKVQAHLQTIWRQQIQDRKGTSSPTNNLETANTRHKRYKLTHKQSGQTANQRYKRYKLTHKQSGDSKSKTEKVQAHLQTIWTDSKSKTEKVQAHLQTIRTDSKSKTEFRYKLTHKQYGDSKSKTEKVQDHLQTIWRQQIQDRKGTSSLTNNLETANPRQKRYKLTHKQSGDSKSKTEQVQAHLQTIWRLQIQDRTGTSSLTNNLETANTRQKGYKLTHKQYGDGKSKTEKVQAHSQTIWTDSKPDIKGTSSLTNNLDRQQIKDRKGTSSVTNNLDRQQIKDIKGTSSLTNNLDRQQIKDIKGASSLTNNLETANTRQKRYKLTYKQSGDSKSKTEKVQAHSQTIWRQQIQDRKGTSSPTNNLETANPRQKRYKLTYKQSGDSKYKT